MDDEIAAFLGKILGEMYRIQKKLDMPRPSDGEIYGLLNGIEPTIRQRFPLIPRERVDAVCSILGR